MVVRPVLLYDSEYWLIRNIHVQRLMVVEIRMIRLMGAHMRVDRIRNKVIRNNLKWLL